MATLPRSKRIIEVTPPKIVFLINKKQAMFEKYEVSLRANHFSVSRLKNSFRKPPTLSVVSNSM